MAERANEEWQDRDEAPLVAIKSELSLIIHVSWTHQQNFQPRSEDALREATPKETLQVV